ncbi:uncharacterized protein LOC101211007 [Cucumis sativus]|uniref:uncharacterized protein LOC101211007 n=1 Tax=Cucumis sativus TaxID=3659 RepID=UPI0012F4B828|nr:uncharacterized protein LOC101211007 [Cucumis sativus]XP_031739858.1 uncharacterized protein LOC101211007 [Cucumis sativus]XP_031739859.1 uncharacterized protein LOC101211007 [Cucumis sativus]
MGEDDKQDRQKMANLHLRSEMISMGHPPMANQPHVINQSQVMNQPQSQVMNQPQVINQPQFLNQSLMNHSQIMSQSQAINQANLLAQPQAMQQSQMIMNHSLPPMMSGNYKVWAHPQAPLDPNKKYRNFPKPSYGNMKQSRSGRGNWKGKGVGDKRINNRRMEKPLLGSISGPNNAAGYQPPSLHELQSQNRLRARKFYSKKKFGNRFAPYAPRNTTSFLIRAKKSGGIASLVSPSPVTPAVLPTPMFSPSREALGDMAKEEWGVDGYGSMKGLIRLRGSENKVEVQDEEEEEVGGGSSDSDVEEHLEVERRLDHDLSRFEMIYQNYGVEYNNCLENRVDDQDSHIAQLEEENLTLKERLFLMERELVDLRRKLQLLEGQNPAIDDVNEEVVENVSENESDGGLEMEYVSEIRRHQDVDVDSKEEDEEVLEIEGGEKCAGEDFKRGKVVEEKYIVNDEMVKESNEQIPEHCVTKDEEFKGELISRKVNECDNMNENLGNILHTDSGVGSVAMANDEAEQNRVVPVKIALDVKEGCEETREDSVSGN